MDFGLNNLFALNAAYDVILRWWSDGQMGFELGFIGNGGRLSSHVARLSCLRLRRGFDYLAPAAVAESSHRQTHDSVPSKEFATLAALALGPAELIKESPLDFQHFDPAATDSRT